MSGWIFDLWKMIFNKMNITTISKRKYSIAIEFIVKNNAIIPNAVLIFSARNINQSKSKIIATKRDFFIVTPPFYIIVKVVLA